MPLVRFSTPSRPPSAQDQTRSRQREHKTAWSAANSDGEHRFGEPERRRSTGTTSLQLATITDRQQRVSSTGWPTLVKPCRGPE
jgi:hypothetical protein